jgi:4-carboxymuconolactone decarboxylase
MVASSQDRTIEADYQDLFGQVPIGVSKRIAVAEMAGRQDAIDAIERLRRVLIKENPLDARTQQLIHLGMLLVLGREEAAVLHTRAAIKAGASPADLHGVLETAAIVGGMPAYSLGAGIVADLLDCT